MSLLWREATELANIPGAHHFIPRPDEEMTLAPTVHDEHRMHPLLRSAGFGESPCGDPTCSSYDPEHAEAMDRAYDAPRTTETHPHGSLRLNGLESHIDPAAVIRYMNHPKPGRPPLVFTHKGEHHILDGHHRLLGDVAAGRPMTFEHANLDKEPS